MRGNDSPSEGGHGVGCWKMRLQAALVAVVLQRTFGRTFGRWVEGKVYGADESVRLGCPKTDRCPISDTFEKVQHARYQCVVFLARRL